MMTARVDRAFARIEAGQIHYRAAGASAPGGPLPLYLAHAGPGSSRGLEPWVGEFGLTRRTIAPDLLGNGDSDPSPRVQPDIPFHADCAARFLDTLGIDRLDFYGSHTGAHVGLEFALAYPERVRRLVLDGLPLFSPELKRELLARYAPVVEPDDFGGHLAWAWNFVRDQAIHFPYFLRDPDHRLARTAVPPAAVIHGTVVDVLRALPTYRLAYHAAFMHDVEARLPRLTTPTLVLCANTDPLGVYLEDVARLTPGAVAVRTSREDKLRVVHEFLDRP